MELTSVGLVRNICLSVSDVKFGHQTRPVGASSKCVQQAYPRFKSHLTSTLILRPRRPPSTVNIQSHLSTQRNEIASRARRCTTATSVAFCDSQLALSLRTKFEHQRTPQNQWDATKSNGDWIQVDGIMAMFMDGRALVIIIVMYCVDDMNGCVFAFISKLSRSISVENVASSTQRKCHYPVPWGVQSPDPRVDRHVR